MQNITIITHTVIVAIRVFTHVTTPAVIRSTFVDICKMEKKHNMFNNVYNIYHPFILDFKGFNSFQRQIAFRQDNMISVNRNRFCMHICLNCTKHKLRI